MATHQQLGNVGSLTTTDSSEDRHGKKSQAYLHTKPHRQLQDKSGKNFERRSCNYCDVVFSFKGGTTSAALRHLKKAHLEKLSENHLVDPEVSVTAGDSSSSTTTNVSQVAECSEEHTVASSPASEGKSDENRIENPTTVDVSSVDGQAEEEAPLVVETEASTSKRVRGRTTSKRKRGDDDCSATECTAPSTCERVGGDRVDTDHGPDNSSSSKLTASQTAIVHFLHHFANELPQPAMRLRFAKHLTHNVGEAEMYNVLDSATQLEYIREFAQPPPPTYSSR